MHSISTKPPSAAPSPGALRHSRILARGVPPTMAATLAALAYPVTERDHAALLASVTAHRCAEARP